MWTGSHPEPRRTHGSSTAPFRSACASAPAGGSLVQSPELHHPQSAPYNHRRRLILLRQQLLLLPLQLLHPINSLFSRTTCVRRRCKMTDTQSETDIQTLLLMRHYKNKTDRRTDRQSETDTQTSSWWDTARWRQTDGRTERDRQTEWYRQRQTSSWRDIVWHRVRHGWTVRLPPVWVCWSRAPRSRLCCPGSEFPSPTAQSQQSSAVLMNQINHLSACKTATHTQIILRQSYYNAKIMVDIRQISNLQNILQRMESFP